MGRMLRGLWVVCCMGRGNRTNSCTTCMAWGCVWGIHSSVLGVEAACTLGVTSRVPHSRAGACSSQKGHVGIFSCSHGGGCAHLRCQGRSQVRPRQERLPLARSQLRPQVRPVEMAVLVGQGARLAVTPEAAALLRDIPRLDGGRRVRRSRGGRRLLWGPPRPRQPPRRTPWQTNTRCSAAGRPARRSPWLRSFRSPARPSRRSALPRSERRRCARTRRGRPRESAAWRRRCV